MLCGRGMSKDDSVVIGASIVAAVSVPDGKLPSVPMLHAGVEILIFRRSVSQEVVLPIHRDFNVDRQTSQILEDVLADRLADMLQVLMGDVTTVAVPEIQPFSLI